MNLGIITNVSESADEVDISSTHIIVCDSVPPPEPSDQVDPIVIPVYADGSDSWADIKSVVIT